MITARPQKNLQAALQYFEEHLGQGDYYSEAQAVPGLWFGRGADRLGLVSGSRVTQLQFERLCKNLHPSTGLPLTVRNRKSDRRVSPTSASPAKSVSLMALLAGDDRIVAAHDRAAVEAMTELEKAAAAYVRKGGRQSIRTTGEIVAAAFRHDCSRALDPQLHTHFVVFNATWDPVEGRWKALESAEMFGRIRLFTEIYRNALAAELLRWGYRLRETNTDLRSTGCLKHSSTGSRNEIGRSRKPNESCSKGSKSPSPTTDVPPSRTPAVSERLKASRALRNRLFKKIR